ncbi:MAG: MMPL family transporter [Candidatus Omnitrophica bacterium]|nr:MMPL family transporter [Candidatus Omnitrophota bacterium]
MVFLLCSIVLASQALLFRIDASADTLLMRNNRNFINTQIVNRNFSPREFLIIAYKPKKTEIFSKNTYKAIEEITEKLEAFERVKSVRSLINAPLFLSAKSNISASLDYSQTTIKKQDYTPEELRAMFKDHPLYEDLLVNKQQDATAIQVLFKINPQLDKIYEQITMLQKQSLSKPLSMEQQEKIKELKAEAHPIEQELDKQRREEVRRIREMLSDYSEQAEVYLGGVHVLGFQLINIIRNDLVFFGGIISVIICLLLWVLFRSLRWVIIPVLCCACSLLCTIGLFGLLGFKATIISSNFISLQLILTLALVIHLIVQYREYQMEKPDWDQRKLVEETMIRKIKPSFYAGLTTSVGFGSLIFSGLQPVISFGWMMIIAMFFSLMVSLILFPSIVMMFKKGRQPSKYRFSQAILGFFSGLALQHRVRVSIITVLVLLLSVVGMVLLDVENSFINYFRDSTLVYKELSFIDCNFGGTTPLDLVYKLKQNDLNRDVLLSSDNMLQLQKIQQALDKYKAVGKIISLVNIADLARQVNKGIPLTEYEFTSLYWIIQESVSKDLLGSFFSEPESQARFGVLIQDTTPGLDRKQLLKDIKNDLEVMGIDKEQYMMTNLFVLYQDILQRLFRSQAMTLGIVFIALALAFGVLFRSFKIALICIIPNLISTVAILGIMGWMRISLDLMTITIASVAMGIAVDDTIHYVHRYQEERRKQAKKEAVIKTHNSVGHAILFTSLIIIIGFSLLCFSDFMPSVLFGLLTGLSMLIALILDLVLLPIMLRKFV